MQRAKKNKIVWNAKIKKKTFKSKNIILIRIKKSKKFKINWYKVYKIVQSEILNTYVVKFLKKFLNSYLINNNRIKLTYVNKKVIKSWRLSRDCNKLKKIKASKNNNNENKQPYVKLVKKTEFALFYSSDVEKLNKNPN